MMARVGGLGQPRRAAVAVVHPDLDHVHLPGGLLRHRLAPLVRRRQLVGDALVGRRAGPGVGRADADAGEPQPRAAHPARGLVGANLERQIARIDPLRQHRGDAEVEGAIEILEVELAGVVVARVAGAALEAGVGVRVDEGGHHGLAAQVHARGPRRHANAEPTRPPAGCGRSRPAASPARWPAGHRRESAARSRTRDQRRRVCASTRCLRWRTAAPRRRASAPGVADEPFVLEERVVLGRREADARHQLAPCSLPTTSAGWSLCGLSAAVELDHHDARARLQVAGQVLQVRGAVLHVVQHVVEERDVHVAARQRRVGELPRSRSARWSRRRPSPWPGCGERTSRRARRRRRGPTARPWPARPRRVRSRRRGRRRRRSAAASGPPPPDRPSGRPRARALRASSATRRRAGSPAAPTAPRRPAPTSAAIAAARAVREIHLNTLLLLRSSAFCLLPSSLLPLVPTPTAGCCDTTRPPCGPDRDRRTAPARRAPRC